MSTESLHWQRGWLHEAITVGPRTSLVLRVWSSTLVQELVDLDVDIVGIGLMLALALAAFVAGSLESPS